MDRTDLRKTNLRLVTSKLRELGQATKPELAQLTGLSVVTINALLKTLTEKGEAEEIAAAPSKGGRPPKRYRFTADHGLALACYMYEEGERNNLVIFLVNLRGEIVEQQGICPRLINRETFLQALSPYIDKYPQIVKIILGLPGTEVDGKLEVIDCPELKNEPLAAWLTAKLERPVQTESDINAAVFGCGTMFGAEEISGTIVGVNWSQKYPLRAGILIGGNMYKGRDGVAGKIGLGQNQYALSDDPLQAAADITKKITQLFNPHILLLYSRQLKMSDAAEVMKICAASLPAKFLPQLIIRPDIGEDYSQGIYALAAKAIT